MKPALRTLVVVSVAAFAVAAIVPYWAATALILRAAETPGLLGQVARWQSRSVSDSIEQIPIRDRSIRVRVFRPAGASRGAALVVSGVHPAGIEEPRLLALARDLAGTGITVVTPEIPDLLSFRLTARVTNAIEDAALWILKRQDLFGISPIAMMGVSFSGGLSIVAAGRPALRDRVAYVLSFGGHDNLPRVLRYLCTGVEPALSGNSGQTRRPNNYALTVVLHQAAELAVPAEQVGGLRQGIETFLRASALDRTDRKQAERTFSEARALQMRMPEPSARLMKHVNDRDVAALGRALSPYLDQLGQDPSLSPDRSAAPSAPVYLLHGRHDNVIPAVETVLLARHLEKRTRVRYLISGFLTHVDVSARPTGQDTWRMIAFWKAVLGER